MDGDDSAELREHGRLAGVLVSAVSTKILKRRVRSYCLFCGRIKVGRSCRRCNRWFRNVQIEIERQMEPLRRAAEAGMYSKEGT